MGRGVQRVPRRSLSGIAVGLVGVMAFGGLGVGQLASAPKFTPVTQLHHIHGLAVDPEDPRILYIATHNGLIRLVGERQWELVGEDRSDLMGFTLDPGNRGVMYASGHPDHPGRGPNPLGVRVSRDRGQTWHPLALGGRVDFHAMTLSPGEGALYGWNGMGVPGLYRIMVQNGAWARVETIGLQVVFSLAAHPLKRGTLLAGTRAGLLVSQDGGRTWTEVALGAPLTRVPVTAVAYHPKDPRFLYAYAVQPMLGFLRSRDGGRTWAKTGFFLGDQDAVAIIAPSPSEPEVLYISTFTSDLYKSTDGGKRWQPLAKQGRPTVP